MSAPSAASNYMVESQSLNSGDDLSQLGIAELAGNRRSHYGIEFVFLIALTFLIRSTTSSRNDLSTMAPKGTLVDTGSARNTLAIVDFKLPRLNLWKWL